VLNLFQYLNDFLSMKHWQKFDYRTKFLKSIFLFVHLTNIDKSKNGK